MTALFCISPLARNMIQLWAFLGCFVAIICIVYGLWRKQYRYSFFAMPCFAVCFFIWATMPEISMFCLGNAVNAFCMTCAAVPVLPCAALLFVCSALSTLVLYRGIRYTNSHITPDSIRLCADAMPCGICYWREGGRVIFANECMSEICFALTGFALQNGEEFFASVTEHIMPVSGNVWSFTHRIIEFKGFPLHELIAADVTELYAKTAALKAENEELARYNEMLREYNLNIDETVRQQEILQAKADIHDEMNRLMLTTVAAGSEGMGSVDDAFALWQRNALLLCREAANDDSSGSVEQLQRIAEALKIRLVWKSAIPQTLTGKQSVLFFSAAQEALANAFKHAGAKAIEIDFIQTPEGIRCLFGNNGRLPEDPVSFTGGLGNLKSLAEIQGADIAVTVSDSFILSLFLPKETKNPPFG